MGIFGCKFDMSSGRLVIDTHSAGVTILAKMSIYSKLLKNCPLTKTNILYTPDTNIHHVPKNYEDRASILENILI